MRGNSGGEAGTDHKSEGEGESEAEEGEREDWKARGRGWVVDEVVCGKASVRYGGGDADGEEGESSVGRRRWSVD